MQSIDGALRISGNSLARLGLKVSLLDTQGLIELYYGIYNPDIAAEERLTDISTINTGIISAPDLSPFEGGDPASETSTKTTPGEPAANPIASPLPASAISTPAPVITPPPALHSTPTPPSAQPPA